MTNVIAFPQTEASPRPERVATTGSVTLFLHIKRTTLIAHLSRRPVVSAQADERVGKN